MRYGFINNFSQTLAAELAPGATTMTLDGGGSALSNASQNLVYHLTLDDGEGVVEVVRVIATSGNSITVARGQEGTEAVVWPEGSLVELRLTAASASGFVWSLPANGVGQNALNIQPDRWGGNDRIASGESSVALGSNSRASGGFSVSLGADSTALGDTAIAIGESAGAQEQDGIAVGRRALSRSAYGIVIGASAEDYGQAERSILIGEGSFIQGDGSMALGDRAGTWGDGQVAIGPRAYPGEIQSALSISAIPVTLKNPGLEESYHHPSATRVSLPFILRSQQIDTTSPGDKDALSAPSGAFLVVDRIDAVVISSAESGGSPAISIGTVVGGGDIVDAHVLSSDVLHHREYLVASPLEEAVSSLFFSVDTASSSSLSIIITVHGYLMES